MQTTQNNLNVWPGYVAAMASLVLSLLLLLAILVFAMTQVGGIVAKYSQELMRAVMPQPMIVKPPPSQLPQVIEKKRKNNNPPKNPEITVRQLKLNFDSTFTEIPAQQVDQLISAIQKIKTANDVKWRIWANYLQGDTVAERSTYLLMLSARKVLIESGVDHRTIDFQLIRVTTPPQGYKEGHIIIYMAPLDVINPGRGGSP